ncbi:hypothetical protein MVEG_12368 [Podila verticillata NRRL 6337]|uniref:Heterokaryon incompatibility domain-containing protein n=1 Tax=Podila verticillata NRRL 6337 TaxID=1069443 RepID=A0A086TIK8_9FUNG|nr:hypothetical protein MVEG_12368 [Podila verticillata NRRL 6337]
MTEHISCTICGENKDKDQFYNGRRQCIPCYKKRNKKNKVAKLEAGLENMSINDTKTLFDDPGFKLLYISDNKTIKLVTPGREVAYRCVSHIWGDVRGHIWEDHGINGVNYQIEFKEEKRDKLLTIMKEYGGYWWVDLLCIDQSSENKPLHLMEDIYKNCHECIAMIDCPENVLEELSEKSFARPVMQLKEMYTLDMTWMYARDNGYREYYPELSLGALLSCLTILYTSTWFTRIWTLQESVLPSTVLLTHETTKFNGCINLAQLLELLEEVRCLLCNNSYSNGDSYAEDNPTRTPSSYSQRMYDSDDYVSSVEDIGEPDYVDIITNKRCPPKDIKHAVPDHRYYDDYLQDSFKELYYSVQSIVKLKDNKDVADVIKTISKLDRRSTYSQDYLYGIAGLVGIQFEPGKGIRDLFHTFVQELAKVDESIAWSEPDWTEEHVHGLYKCITSDNMKVVKEGIMWADDIHVVKVDNSIHTVVVGGDEKTVDASELEDIIMKYTDRVHYNCEAIQNIMQNLQDNSYIYIGDAIIFSREYIGRFTLHDVRVNEMSDHILVKDNRIIGNVFTRCRCEQRHNLDETRKGREERQMERESLKERSEYRSEYYKEWRRGNGDYSSDESSDF